MNKEELAKEIHESSYDGSYDGFYEDERGFFETAKKNNLIIIAGYSDGLIEIRGAIRGETGEGSFWLGRNGVVESFGSAKEDWDSEEDCLDWIRRKKNSIEIRGYYGRFWRFSKPSIASASFDLYENGELASEGLVIDKNDLP